MAHEKQVADPYVPVAEIEVDVVRPRRSGFLLDGRGVDGSDYRLALHLDMPVDGRTRDVLAELLSQSEWRIARRARPPLATRAIRTRRRSGAK